MRSDVTSARARCSSCPRSPSRVVLAFLPGRAGLALRIYALVLCVRRCSGSRSRRSGAPSRRRRRCDGGGSLGARQRARRDARAASSRRPRSASRARSTSTTVCGRGCASSPPGCSRRAGGISLDADPEARPRRARRRDVGARAPRTGRRPRTASPAGFPSASLARVVESLERDVSMELERRSRSSSEAGRSTRSSARSSASATRSSSSSSASSPTGTSCSRTTRASRRRSPRARSRRC